MLKVKVIWGSARKETFGRAPAEFTAELAKKQTDWDVEYIDLAVLNLPLTIGSPIPSQANGVYVDPVVQAWGKTINETDAYIIVTTEYNHGYPSILKNALDHLYPEWHRKAVAFVGYGGQLGGGRAIEQLRQVIIELHMVSTRDAVYIPSVWGAFDESGKPHDTELASKFEQMFGQLAWWGNALKIAREKGE